MHTKLISLLSELEKQVNTDKVKAIIEEMIPLSVSYQMIELNIEDAISNFEESHKRTATDEEKESIRFGFMCGISCE